MTTIAFSPREMEIAVDSRGAAGNTIITDNSEKRLVRDGVEFFLCGTAGDREEFITAWLSGERSVRESLDCHGFVWDGENLHRSGAFEGEIHIGTESLDEPLTDGSGRDHALTALDLGLTAREAVKMAIKRDCNSGGKIRVYKLKRRARA